MSEALLGVLLGGAIAVVGTSVTPFIQDFVSRKKERKMLIEDTVESLVSATDQFHSSLMKAREAEGLLKYYRTVSGHLTNNPDLLLDTGPEVIQQLALDQLQEQDKWTNNAEQNRIEVSRLSFRLRRLLPEHGTKIKKEVSTVLDVHIPEIAMPDIDKEGFHPKNFASETDKQIYKERKLLDDRLQKLEHYFLRFRVRSS